ncbi:MAG: type II toxin-antitoxin system RelE/ParE family toxin [Peptostreptococcaceae bacterium]|nr:type II toxin-antitoxin system RelE/ParE family toxin [Peptostreptococcaceae bacterium]
MHLKFHPEVIGDIEKFDNSIRILLRGQLLKIKSKPEIGKLLGNKAGNDLSSCRKIYFHNKRYRIVYEIIGEYVLVYAVGKREKFECYKDASSRKNKT